MDVYLKKRWDLIPNIVETVKGYAEYEKSTLKEIVELRNGVYDNMSTDEKFAINTKLSPNINRLIALAESFPELKASENFNNLSQQLTRVEDEIANSIKYYNGSVRIFNDKIQMFPSNIAAKVFGFKEEKMFESAEKQKLEQMVIVKLLTLFSLLVYHIIKHLSIGVQYKYFYNILPYTYVLGVSNKWIKKFESISLQAPNWYDGYSTFNASSFGSFVTSTMSSASSSMSSSPSGSSGGGSSGGHTTSSSRSNKPTSIIDRILSYIIFFVLFAMSFSSLRFHSFNCT